jgi:YegS/Rv2252/BmrU family lipid kinase
MPPLSNTDILFIINPFSGGLKKIDWQTLIRDYFKSHSFTIQFCILNGKDDEFSILQTIKKRVPQKIVAVGGDGTVSLVAKQLLGSSIPLGILPAGSANGMATNLKIPGDPLLAISTILTGRVQKCDVIKINENDISIHLSDVGLNARVMKYFDKSATRGKWLYAIYFVRVLCQRKLFKVHITGDNLDINIKAFMVVIANARQYGTGAFIDPEGIINDGKFELVIVRRISFTEIFNLFFSHTPFNPKKIEIFQMTKATIIIKRKTDFQIDGEYKGEINQVNAEILPSALNLIAPK